MKREYTVVYQQIKDGWMMAIDPKLPGQSRKVGQCTQNQGGRRRVGNAPYST